VGWQADATALAGAALDAGDGAPLLHRPQCLVDPEGRGVHAGGAAAALVLQAGGVGLCAGALPLHLRLVVVPARFDGRELALRLRDGGGRRLHRLDVRKAVVVQLAAPRLQALELPLEVGELLRVADGAAVEPGLDRLDLGVEVLELGVELALKACEAADLTLRCFQGLAGVDQLVRLAQALVDVGDQGAQRVTRQVDLLEG
jgi:hypothetical protein